MCLFLLWLACVLLVTMSCTGKRLQEWPGKKFYSLPLEGNLSAIEPRTKSKQAPNYSPIYFCKHPESQLLFMLVCQDSLPRRSYWQGVQIWIHIAMLPTSITTLVSCLKLLSRFPTGHQADFVVRMYAGIEKKFSSLLWERLHAANNF